jgi:DNA (cytosine-5)-methyltransferase 1
MNMKNSKLKIISLFSGVGGLDLGYEKSGFEISVAVEEDSSCCNTLRLNRPNLKIIEDDISKVSTKLILEEANLKPLQAAIVIGGVPCQPFSLAGDRMGMDDPRGKLLLEFARVVRESLPKCFVIENVKGMLNWQKGKAIEAIKNEFENPIGYQNKKYQYKINYQVLNSADFGVPQKRERLFIIGNRINKDFIFPEPTHADLERENQKDIFGKQYKPYATVEDAIGDLPPADEPSDTAKRVSQSIKGRIKKHGY